jgi:hypothetical protein
MASSQTSTAAHPCPDGDDLALATARYGEATARDPRRCAFGYLAGDPGSGAIGSFVWFGTAPEMLEFLSTVEVRLLQFDDRESADIIASLERAIGTTLDVRRLDRHAISAAFDGWCEILWIGTFGDLCERGGAFQTSLRLGFRTADDLGEHGGPIADDELERFVAYLAAGAASS